MKWLTVVGIAVYLTMVLTAAVLERKLNDEPCVQALEEIAEVVNAGQDQ